MAGGQAAHLYDHDPNLFQIVETPAWTATAAGSGFSGQLHPYVQTPLWAWALQPLCTTLSFDAFKTVFLLLGLIALVGVVELSARAWAPKFLEPLPLAALLAAVALSTPFQYAQWLVQTHMLFVLPATAAIILADRKRPAAAGIALACAAAVKISPAFLAIYWLARGEWKAALWFAAASALILALTVLVAGWPLTADYVANLSRVSNVLLTAYNNQSLAAAMHSGDLMSWRILPLDAADRALSGLLLFAAVALAGWLSRGDGASGAGPAFALVAMTVFTPIAWSHYSLVLIPAGMVLVQTGGVTNLTLAGALWLLNIEPFAVDPMHPAFALPALSRSHFLAGLLALAAMGWLLAGRARLYRRPA